MTSNLRLTSVVPTAETIVQITNALERFGLQVVRNEFGSLTEKLQTLSGADKASLEYSYEQSQLENQLELLEPDLDSREAGKPGGVSLMVEQMARGPLTQHFTSAVDLPEALRILEPLPESFRINFVTRGVNVNLAFTSPDSVFVTVNVNVFWSSMTDPTETEVIAEVQAILEESPYVPPVAPPPPFKVVIGHGNDQQWRILRDELRDEHGFELTAFEGKPRAGQTISTILEDMANEATVAVLVLTKADAMANGSWRARQNVIHEVGYFQGRLGWSNALIVCEEGVETLSNLDGTQRIDFPHENISAAVGRVAATLRRLERDRG